MNNVVITPDNPRVAEGRLSGFPVLDLFLVAVRNRELLRALIQRDIEMRYRGSVFGALWLVVVPLIMLLTYTFIFVGVFKTKFGQVGSLSQSALAIYAGLIVFGLFSEPVNRAATLIVDNSVFVKRVVFPLRIMSWMTIATSAFGAAVSTCVLVAFHLVLAGLPPATALLAPLALIPVCLVTLGASWHLAAIGVFVRDIKHVVAIGMTLLMFVTPIFYPVANVPHRFQMVLYANPLTYSVETFRCLLIEGVLPTAWVWLAYLAGCLVFASTGYMVFARLQKRFADVV